MTDMEGKGVSLLRTECLKQEYGYHTSIYMDVGKTKEAQKKELPTIELI